MTAMPLPCDYITGPQLRLVGTGAASDDVLASPSFIADPWMRVENDIRAMTEQGANLLAQDLQPPTNVAMQWAAILINRLRMRPAPLRTLPNGEGGIVLEWIDASPREIVRTIEVTAEGKIELIEFFQNRIERRVQLC